MKTLNIRSPYPGDMTVIPNKFIDDYMPGANGEFVKVFLYMLRVTSGRGVAPSLPDIADALDYTENDVLRALKFWDKEGLMKLGYDDEGNLTEIVLRPLETRYSSEPEKPSESSSSSFDLYRQNAPFGYASPKKEISPVRLREMKDNEEFSQLIFIVENYMNKTLSANAVMSLVYYYDTLGFSTDLIDYLIEYCVSSGHKSFSYIDTVALSWYNEEISTVQEAKKQTNSFNNYYKIMKFLGIRGRDPIDNEISTMKKWTNEYGFSLDLIEEACRRTIVNTGQPSFNYADKILSSWKADGASNIEDVRKLDESRKKDRENASAGKGASGKKNSFNNFDQRTYNYDDLESRFLRHKQEG